MKARNTFLTFIVSSFWHGANWTFIVWGVLNAIYFLPLPLSNNNRNNLDVIDHYLPTLKELEKVLLTFGLTVFAWIFFRANSLDHAFSYIVEILSSSLFSIPKFNGFGAAITTLMLVATFVLIEWRGRQSQHSLEYFGLKWKRPLRFVMYYTIILCII